MPSGFVRELRGAADEQLGEPMPRWTIHNIRHTVSTHLREDPGVTRDVVALILGHTQGGARARRIYDRYSHEKEKRTALDAWGRKLESIVSGEEFDASVVSLSRA